MDDLTAALGQAIRWLLGGHAEVYGIVWVSVKIVTVATLIASVLGMPLGVSLAVSQFRGKRVVASLFNTLLSMPTVVARIVVCPLFASALHVSESFKERVYSPL